MDALIGWTGLIGSTLRRARGFDAMFRSTDIDAMRGGAFDLVICAGVRAEKWKANRDPDGDRAGIARLTDVLRTTRIRQLVLISTVDAYPVPVGVDEGTPIDPEAGHPYGRHRYALERFCQDRFECTVLRLPGLFGPGLKKNAIFDLLHENMVSNIHPDSAFQFYALDRLWADIQRVLAARLPLVNVTVEPTAMRDVAARAFGRTLHENASAQPARYDVRSKYAVQFGGALGYWYDAESTLDAIAAFVASERRHAGGATP
jgi:nucleoside-diphosphate-sugar epimerase